jgi:Flp pilus assembly pilin Flp
VRPSREAETDLGWLERVTADTTAQDLAEYGICLGIIALVAGAVAVAVAGDVGALWTSASGAVSSAL